MKSIGEAIEEMVQSMPNTTREITDDEYIGENGLIYCKKCNTPKQTLEKFFGKHQFILCKCEEERIKKEKEMSLQRAKQRRVDRIKQLSMLGDKYREVSFSNTEVTHNKDFAIIYNRCKRYCDVASQVLDKGIGIYLFGDKGTGKSRITACMANELMDNYYTVLYTNFAEISKYIRNTFKTHESEYDFLERLTNIDFLFIDDFGTELVSKNDQDLWLQEKVFEVVNKRYNNNKPIIFTSNYSLRQLIEERGMADKTVDRINEMCTVMKLTGESYRRHVKTQREELF